MFYDILYLSIFRCLHIFCTVVLLVFAAPSVFSEEHAYKGVSTKGSSIEYSTRRWGNSTIVEGKFQIRYEGEVLTVEHVSRNSLGLASHYIPSTITKYRYFLMFETSNGKFLYVDKDAFANKSKLSFTVGDQFEELKVTLDFDPVDPYTSDEITTTVFQTSLKEPHGSNYLEKYDRILYTRESATDSAIPRSTKPYYLVPDYIIAKNQTVSKRVSLQYRDLGKSARKTYNGEFFFELRGNTLAILHQNLNAFSPSNIDLTTIETSAIGKPVEFQITDSESKKVFYLHSHGIFNHGMNEFKLPFSPKQVVVEARSNRFIDFDPANLVRTVENSRRQVDSDRLSSERLPKNIILDNGKMVILSQQSNRQIYDISDGKTKKVRYSIEVGIHKFDCYFELQIGSENTVKIVHYSKNDLTMDTYTETPPLVTFELGNLSSIHSKPFKVQKAIENISLPNRKESLLFQFAPIIPKVDGEAPEVYFYPIDFGFKVGPNFKPTKMSKTVFSTVKTFCSKVFGTLKS